MLRKTVSNILIFLLSIFCLGAAVYVDVININSPGLLPLSLPTEDACWNMFSAQVGVSTIGLTVVSLIISIVDTKVYGLSLPLFIMEREPRGFAKYKVVITGIIIAVVANWFITMSGLYATSVAIFVITSIISVNLTYQALKIIYGKDEMKDRVEAYILKIKNEQDIYNLLSELNEFLINKDSINEALDDIMLAKKLFFDCLRYSKPITNKKNLSVLKNILYAAAESGNDRIKYETLDLCFFIILGSLVTEQNITDIIAGFDTLILSMDAEDILNFREKCKNGSSEVEFEKTFDEFFGWIFKASMDDEGIKKLYGDDMMQMLDKSNLNPLTYPGMYLTLLSGNYYSVLTYFPYEKSSGEEDLGQKFFNLFIKNRETKTNSSTIDKIRNAIAIALKFQAVQNPKHSAVADYIRLCDISLREMDLTLLNILYSSILNINLKTCYDNPEFEDENIEALIGSIINTFHCLNTSTEGKGFGYLRETINQEISLIKAFGKRKSKVTVKGPTSDMACFAIIRHFWLENYSSWETVFMPRGEKKEKACKIIKKLFDNTTRFLDTDYFALRKAEMKVLVFLLFLIFQNDPENKNGESFTDFISRVLWQNDLKGYVDNVLKNDEQFGSIFYLLFFYLCPAVVENWRNDFFVFFEYILTDILDDPNLSVDDEMKKKIDDTYNVFSQMLHDMSEDFFTQNPELVVPCCERIYILADDWE
ncbi:MAG: hypothetical protein LBM59_03255 [Ruminococcus sp.]|jgi:hypothetical protein|nr:hypothetical protein [Ruminococcus sp.]